MSTEKIDIELLYKICVVIIITGGVGGIAGGLYNKHRNFPLAIEKGWDYVTYFFCGVVCSFGVAVLCTTISSLLSNSGENNKALYLIGISLLSGFFSMRLLPKIGDQLETRLKLIESQTAGVAKKAEESIEYTKLLSFSDTAFSTKNPVDIESAIVNIENNIKMFATDRTINIYLGRLYRQQRKYNKAIYALREFIEHKQQQIKNYPGNNSDKEACGAAYFNIACYHVLKAAEAPSEENRLFEESITALRETKKYNPMLAASASNDPDLANLKAKKPEIFNELI